MVYALLNSTQQNTFNWDASLFMLADYISLEDLCSEYNRTRAWVYKNSKVLDGAKLRCNGKVLRPLRFCKRKIAVLFYNEHKPERSKVTQYVKQLTDNQPPIRRPEELWQ